MSSEKEGLRDFCPVCRKNRTYHFGKRDYIKVIDGRVKTFPLTEPVCDTCGSIMSPPGSIDAVIEEYEELLREDAANG